VKTINDIIDISGEIIFVSDQDLNYGLFGIKMDIDISDDTDFISVVDNIGSLNL
jgi:hypothetical protein